MKQKDLALILIIVSISAVVSLFVSKAIIVTSNDRQQQVEVVQPITASFPEPDSRYFNKDALDPTKLITIGQNTNPDPFKAASGDGSSTSQ